MKEIQTNELLMFLEDGKIIVVEDRDEREEMLKKYGNEYVVLIITAHELIKTIKGFDETAPTIIYLEKENRRLRDQIQEMTRRYESEPRERNLRVTVKDG